MEIAERLLKELQSYSWFLPTSPIIRNDINRLVELHQERLKPFGLKDILPIKTYTIWPGRKSLEELLEIHQKCKQTVHYMILENVMNVIREIALSHSAMAKIDTEVRYVNTKIKSKSYECAVEVAGLSVRATIPMAKVVKDEKGNLLEIENTEGVELEIANKASEDAADTAGHHLSWIIIEKHLQQKEYLNPFKPLLHLFKLGLWPIGACNNEYVVFIPGGTRTKIV